MKPDHDAQAPKGTAPAAQVHLLMQELQDQRAELALQNDELRRAQDALALSHARYFDLYELAPVGYCTVNAYGLIVEANRTASALLGLPGSALVNRAFVCGIPAEYRSSYARCCRQVRKTGQAHTCELPLLRGDAALLWVSLSVNLTQATAELALLRVAFKDISALKHMAQALQRSEEKYRLIAENISDGILETAADHRVVYASPAYLKQLGYPEKPPTALTLAAIYARIHPDDRKALRARMVQAVYHQHTELRYSYRLRHAGDLALWRESHARFRFDAAGRYAGAYVVCRDVSEQKHAQALRDTLHLELQQSHQRLRDLSAQDEERREQERKSIAREVHDELGQVLTTLRLNLGAIEMRFGSPGSALVEQVHGMKTLVDRALHAVRHVVGHLRPAELDVGLPAALAGLCDEFSQRVGLPCPFLQRGTPYPLDEARAIVIYRIAQESLTNISRHAHATQASVMLRWQKHLLLLTVSDNGCGFDPQQASNGKKSWGLLGMSERATALHGQLSIRSAPNGGCTVELSSPLHPPTIPNGARHD